MQPWLTISKEKIMDYIQRHHWMRFKYCKIWGMRLILLFYVIGYASKIIDWKWMSWIRIVIVNALRIYIQHSFSRKKSSLKRWIRSNDVLTLNVVQFIYIFCLLFAILMKCLKMFEKGYMLCINHCFTVSIMY